MYSKSAVTRIQELRYFLSLEKKEKYSNFLWMFTGVTTKVNLSRDSDNTTSFKIQSYHKINWHN